MVNTLSHNADPDADARSTKDAIYVVDPATRKTVAVQPTTFAELAIKERQDLQSWLMAKPEVLGEPLLLITTELSRFDKSNRRLDMLLLDKRGVLVVAELKLDAAGTLADQQAIRYAAFCSTMTIDDVAGFLAARMLSPKDEAEVLICEFLNVPKLPVDFGAQPRIILAAGSFRDQELTATVLWLRKCGLEISCVELTPYRYPKDEHNILLVPRVLIPLPEARSYQIGVERQERNVNSKRAASETWTWERFSEAIQNKNPAWLAPVEAILEWTNRTNLKLFWGSGAQVGSLIPVVELEGEWFAPVIVYTNGYVEAQFQWLRKKPPFTDTETRAEFAARLNEIAGVQIGGDKLELRPSFSLDRLVVPASLQIFMNALDWFVITVRAQE